MGHICWRKIEEMALYEKGKVEEKLLSCTLLAFGIGGLCAQPLGSFIPFLRNEYGFSYGLSGILLGAQSVGNLITTLLAGLLPMYLGRRNAITATALWMAVSWFLFASGIGSPAILLAACFMNGISRGGNATFCNTQISTLPSDKTARGYNLLHGMFAVGAMISPALLVLMMEIFKNSGWRIMALVLACASLIQIIDYRTMPMLPDIKKKGIRSSDRHFLKSGVYWISTLMLFCYISAEYSIVGWLVTYFQDTGLLRPDSSQMMSTLFWTMMFSGRFFGALMAGRMKPMTLLIADGAGCIVFSLLALNAFNGTTALLGIAGVALFMATVYPTAFAYGSSAIVGNALGVAIMTTFGSFGGIFTPIIIGAVADRKGIQSGMSLIVVFFALLFMSILAAFFISKKSNHSPD